MAWSELRHTAAVKVLLLWFVKKQCIGILQAKVTLECDYTFSHKI